MAVKSFQIIIVLPECLGQFQDTEIGDIIIKVAQGSIDEQELSDWLRRKRIEELEEKQRV